MIEIPRILLGVFIAIQLLFFLSVRRKIINQKTMFIALFMAITMVVISYIHSDPLKLAIIKCLCIFSAFLLTQHYSFEEYAEAFTRVMVFFAIMALLLEVIAYSMPGIADSLPRMINTANVEIMTIGFAGFRVIDLGAIFIRSFGIFWEPGVFQIYLNIAIIYELFIRKATRWKNIVLLIAGVIITFSTTGYIALLWILLSYFLFEKKEKVTKKNIAAMAFLLLLIIAVFFISDYSMLYDAVFGKMTNEESGSVIARSASVFVNLSIFWEHPLVGVGMDAINQEMVLRSMVMYSKSTTHNTNTLLYPLAAHGILYGGLFILGTCYFPKNLSSKKIARVAILVALIMLYIGENLRYSILPYILIFYGFNCVVQKRRTR